MLPDCHRNGEEAGGADGVVTGRAGGRRDDAARDVDLDAVPGWPAQQVQEWACRDPAGRVEPADVKVRLDLVGPGGWCGQVGQRRLWRGGRGGAARG